MFLALYRVPGIGPRSVMCKASILPVCDTVCDAGEVRFQNVEVTEEIEYSQRNTHQQLAENNSVCSRWEMDISIRGEQSIDCVSQLDKL